MTAGEGERDEREVYAAQERVRKAEAKLAQAEAVVEAAHEIRNAVWNSIYLTRYPQRNRLAKAVDEFDAALATYRKSEPTDG